MARSYSMGDFAGCCLMARCSSLAALMILSADVGWGTLTLWCWKLKVLVIRSALLPSMMTFQHL